LKKSDPAPSEVPARGVSPSNRSLERGILVLRAFRPGSDLLGNGDLAERTGLPRATVSRLTQTLVGTGLLEHDPTQRAYRLAAPVLSLAHAMRSGSAVLEVAAPLMRTVASKLHVNVGLAVPDQSDMVYLESVRYNSKVSLRTVVVGQRIPMELTSLGRAYLAVADETLRLALLEQFRARQRSDWQRIEKEIAQAAESVRRNGFCAASWQPEVVALATPIVLENRPIHVLNVSVSTPAALTEVIEELKTPLLDLRARIGYALGALN
jgi:DNA-binding IclR family transcriptional regulator